MVLHLWYFVIDHGKNLSLQLQCWQVQVWCVKIYLRCDPWWTLNTLIMVTYISHVASIDYHTMVVLPIAPWIHTISISFVPLLECWEPLLPSIWPHLHIPVLVGKGTASLLAELWAGIAVLACGWHFALGFCSSRWPGLLGGMLASSCLSWTFFWPCRILGGSIMWVLGSILSWVGWDCVIGMTITVDLTW